MTEALTAKSWLATLDRIVRCTPDDSTRTLAKMLFEIITVTDDRRIDDVLDAYGARLMGERA